MITSSCKTKPVLSFVLRASDKDMKELIMKRKARTEIELNVTDEENGLDLVVGLLLCDEDDGVCTRISEVEMNDSQAPMRMKPPPAIV